MIRPEQSFGARRVIGNHHVDTLLTLDEHRTLQDDSYGFCFCLRLDLLRRRHVGLCAADLAPATMDDERALRYLAQNGPIDSQLGIRTHPTCLLGLIQGAGDTSVLTIIGDIGHDPADEGRTATLHRGRYRTACAFRFDDCGNHRVRDVGQARRATRPWPSPRSEQAGTTMAGAI